MKTLHVNVTDKIATYRQRDGAIVCGNSDYQIQFTFDSEWDEYSEKTARFIWGGEYTEVVFSGDLCPIPIITNTQSCEVGVYAGDLCTTTSAEIGCIRSILCGNQPPSTEDDANHASEAKAAAEEAKGYAEEVKAALGDVGDLTAALDGILAIQEALIGGDVS